jgi:hypothetical protein
MNGAARGRAAPDPGSVVAQCSRRHTAWAHGILITSSHPGAAVWGEGREVHELIGGIR